jgi:hypothetical protein
MGVLVPPPICVGIDEYRGRKYSIGSGGYRVSLAYLLECIAAESSRAASAALICVCVFCACFEDLCASTGTRVLEIRSRQREVRFAREGAKPRKRVAFRPRGSNDLIINQSTNLQPGTKGWPCFDSKNCHHRHNQRRPSPDYR